MQPHIDIPHDGRQRSTRQRRARLLLVAIVTGAVWLAAFRVPGLRELVAAVCGAFAVGLGVVAGAGFLALVGFGLFALCDRVVRCMRRLAYWPPED